MRVLNISAGPDTGGNGIRAVRAFAKLTDWEYRFARRTTNYLDYPADLPWSEAAAFWRRADVVHVREGFLVERTLSAPRRPSVIHHHGTIFRRHARELIRAQRQRGAVGLAATLDLWLMAPDDLVWAPAFYDLDWLAAMRQPVSDGVLRIAHAPTNRAVKSTEAFLAAVDRLGRELPVEVILVERRSWAECLAAKARADVYFDQVTLGYGNNAIEAWGMGQPVIAGAAEPTLREMERRFGSLPFVLADEGSIYRALRHLADPDNRAAWAIRGRGHAAKFHSEAAGVAQLSGIYEAVLERRAVAA